MIYFRLQRYGDAITAFERYLAAAPARAETADVLPDMKTIGAAASPFDLRDGDKARYSAIFGALKGERWAEAKAMILDAKTNGQNFRPQVGDEVAVIFLSAKNVQLVFLEVQP